MKIILADDHELFRRGLEATLSRCLAQPTFLHAGSGAELLRLCPHHQDARLLLLDLKLPDAHGLELLYRLRETDIGIPVAVLSADDDAATMQAALQAGCRGYLPKSLATELMTSAVQLILAGGLFVPPALLGHPFSSQIVPNGNVRNALTERKREVLSLLAAGYSNKRICRVLNLSEGTVKTHIQAIYRELNVNNRIEAANRARDLEML